jgi:hypothetical protein
MLHDPRARCGPTKGEVGAGRQAEFMTLTRNQYYEESGINVVAAKKTEARNSPIQSSPRSTLSDSEENCQDRRVQRIRTMLGNEQADFDATYNSRNALGDKFSLYEAS